MTSTQAQSRIQEERAARQEERMAREAQRQEAREKSRGMHEAADGCEKCSAYMGSVGLELLYRFLLL